MDWREQIKRARIARRLKQAELGRRVGMSRAAIARLMHDPKANPTVCTLQKFADALDTTFVVPPSRKRSEPAS